MDTGEAANIEHAEIVRWQHVNGSQAHCLARHIQSKLDETCLVVLSELADNPRACALSADPHGARAATERAFSALCEGSAKPAIWLLHHGEFSSYDAAGEPETFTRLEVHAPTNDLTDLVLLDQEEVSSLLGALTLRPVPVVLDFVRDR